MDFVSLTGQSEGYLSMLPILLQTLFHSSYEDTHTFLLMKILQLDKLVSKPL